VDFDKMLDKKLEELAGKTQPRLAELMKEGRID